MNNFIAFFAYLVVGLLMGALFSEHISMSLSATNWDNLWTYGWIILWPLFLAVKFFLVFLIFVVVAGTFMVIYQFGIDRGWWY